MTPTRTPEEQEAILRRLERMEQVLSDIFRTECRVIKIEW